MEAQKPKQRRQPPQRYTVTVTNYARYQEQLKGKRRVWVRFDRNTPNDLKLRRVSPEARWVFVCLVMISDDGTLSGITDWELSKMIDMRYETVASAMKQLSSGGLVKIINSTTAQLQDNYSATTAQLQPDYRTTPENGVCLYNELANDAGSSALQTDRQTESTEKKEGIEEDGGIFSSPPSAPDSLPTRPAAPTVSAVDLIVQAMAAQAIPYKGIDPMIGYRAKATSIMARAVDVDLMTYATWACMAIAAVGPCDDWEVRVNTSLKQSRLGGGYVPPEVPRRKDDELPPDLQAVVDEFTAMGI